MRENHLRGHIYGGNPYINSPDIVLANDLQQTRALRGQGPPETHHVHDALPLFCWHRILTECQFG